MVVLDHRHQFRGVGQPELAREVHERIGDDLLALERAAL
jgi:hypothetical protein